MLKEGMEETKIYNNSSFDRWHSWPFYRILLSWSHRNYLLLHRSIILVCKRASIKPMARFGVQKSRLFSSEIVHKWTSILVIMVFRWTSFVDSTSGY